MKQEMPLVSIIVVNYNGKEFLKDCLDSLHNLNYQTDKLEIIMVDNGSSDNSLDYTEKKFPAVKIIINNKNNYTKANNLGIKAAKGDYIALINNDIKVDKNWSAELIRIINTDVKIGAVGSKILFMDGAIQSVGHQEYPDFYWGDIGFKEEDEGQYSNYREVVSICGCSVLYRRECLEDIGFLDEDFNMFMEDVDMGIRCRKKGWKIVTCPESIIYHKFHGTIEAEENARHWQEVNRLLLIAKHWPEKLPDALAGRGYFTIKNNIDSARDICEVIAKVSNKILKEHGWEMLDKLSPDLFKAVRKIYNFEKNDLIGEVKNKYAIISQKDREISALRQQKDQEISALRQQKDQEISVKDEELSLKSQQLLSLSQTVASLKQALEFSNQEKELELNSNKLLLQQVRRELNDIYASTGYRYILRLLWDFMWPIKQAVKKYFYAVIEIRLRINKKLSRLFEGLYVSVMSSLKMIKLFLKFIIFSGNLIWINLGKLKIAVFIKESVIFAKKRPYHIFKNVFFVKAYISHIFNNTLPMKPKRMTLMLISSCNLRCKFCDIPERDYSKKELSKEDAFKIIDSAARLGVEQLDITGGEPLLHKDFFEIVTYACSLGLRIMLSTNGTLIKKHMAEIMDSAIFCVTVSVDGFVDTYNYLRNHSGDYSEIIDSVEYLKERNKRVSISFVVTNKNINELEKLYNFFKERKIFFAFFPVINKPDLYLRSHDDKKIFINFVNKLKNKKEISLVQYKYYMSMLKYYNNGIGRVRCLGLYREFGVDINGDLFPCCVWKNESRPVNTLGNLLNDDIEELWFSDRIRKARQKIFTEGCGGCYNPDICSLPDLTGINFLLNRPAWLRGKNLTLKPVDYAKPSHVHMRLTLRCNLSCRHCDIWKAKDNRSELSTHEWKTIISKIHDWLGPFKLELAGGEMFLRGDIVDIIKYASAKGISANITTNAMLVNVILAKSIIEAGLRAVTISLDGYRSQTHNYIRNNENAYKTVMENANNFYLHKERKKPFDINLATVITDHNLDELEDLVMLTKNGIFSSITFQALDNNFHAQYYPLWFENNEFWPKDIVKINKAMDTLISLKFKGYAINNSFEQLNAMKEYFNNSPGMSFNSCSTGEKNLIVNELGQVLLCWNMPPVANLLDDLPVNIWNNELSKKRRGEIKRCKRTCRILNCNYLAN